VGEGDAVASERLSAPRGLRRWRVGWAGALRGWSGPGERERCAGWAGESRLGRAREGKEGVGRGFGWARKLGLGFALGFSFLFLFTLSFQI
jgi:hypothetical protein